jgi:hypothetical protein
MPLSWLVKRVYGRLHFLAAFYYDPGGVTAADADRSPRNQTEKRASAGSNEQWEVGICGGLACSV